MHEITAVEFFSGIGAFAQASESSNIRILAAFDQSSEANRVYRLNYDLLPSARNLDTISADDIPSAQMWWLSPPCKPYTVRGKQLDSQDTRAASLKRLIELIPEKLPAVILLENVAAFKSSQMHARLINTLDSLDYEVHEVELDPTMFGTPMRRPRFFVAAVRRAGEFSWLPKTPPTTTQASPLHAFLDQSVSDLCNMPQEQFDRYGMSLDLIDLSKPDSTAICFTSGYGRSMKSSGSFIRLTGGGARRFSPVEMLRLFGFSPDFRFPDDMSLDIKWRLIGNSVDVRCIKFLLGCVGGIEFGAARGLS